MRGLPFPSNAVFDPETASEHGTPFSTVDDIPIDPVLAGGPVIDPAITGARSVLPENYQQVHPVIIQGELPLPCQRHYSQEPLGYHQGPQGDPFAPQPPAAYLPIPEAEVPLVPKPQKRKRRPRREEECGFCQGNDSKNNLGEREVMVSCEECGRSGHPSCMELGKVADVVRSYPWKCIECKTCEICQEKGDDDRILFCDFCDRGWHMDCLRPPLEEEPPGQWHCPLCPPPELLIPPDATLAHPDTFPSASLDHPAGESDPDENGGEPSGEDPETDVQVNDSATESSDSDSDSDETVDASATQRQQPVKRKKKPSRRVSEAQTPRPAKRMRIKVRSPAAPLIVRLRLPPKGKGKEREEDVERNIFEDLLTPAERDTSKCSIDTSDRTRFEKSRQAAEEQLYPAPGLSTPAAENPELPVAGPSSRPLRSATVHQLTIPPSLPTVSPVPSTPSLLPQTPGTLPQTPSTPIGPDGQSTLRIRTIRFGPYDIHPWYDAPFPEEYANIPDGRLWICEFCLKYMRSRFAFGRHQMKCKARHPPGDEIYRDASISIFEVDGRKNKIYCQNLCLLSKMFLDHKSLFYDVEPFLFYVMTEVDDIGAHFVGYFSKEKCSPKQYNVSCIMTLPVRQRQGWGNFLIDFSYLLSMKEQRVGSPEKPLSGLGALGYKNYWTLAIMRHLRSAPPKPTLEDISRATSMTAEDIFNTLTQQDMISVDAAFPTPVRPSPGQSIKFPRGRKNGIARRHLQRTNTQKQIDGGGSKSNTPFVPPVHYEISWDQDKVERWLEAWERKGYLRLKPEKLKWTPFVLSRTRAGVELIQAEATMDFGSTAQPETPRTPMDTGTPILDMGNRTKSSSSTQGPPSKRDEGAGTGRGVVDISAAHLFDDLLRDQTTTPRRQLRSRMRDDASLASPAKSTRSASAQAILDGDSETQGGNANALVDGTNSGTPEVDESTPTVPIKRRRGRPPRVRPSEVVPPSSPFPARESLPPRPASPRKRRKLDSPIPDDLRTPLDLSKTIQHEDHVEPPVEHHRQVVNGHAKNGVRGDLGASSRNPSGTPAPEGDAGLPGEYQELGQKDRLHDGFMPQEHSDVKSEDMGTPLTGLTSRHSVPSDDTVFVTEGANGVVRSKISEEVQGATTLPTSPEQARGEGVQIGDPTEDSDLDAEGEPDDEL